MMIVIFSGLIAAIVWNLFTWWLGIPSSSSHTLIGGFAGAAIASAGFGAVNSAIVIKTAAFIFLAPLSGNDHGLYHFALVYLFVQKGMGAQNIFVDRADPVCSHLSLLSALKQIRPRS